jgi:hypothetical protein
LFRFFQEDFIAKPNKATQAKRNRERSRQEWQQIKEEKKALRGDSKKEREDLIAQGLDPDLVGIYPGPQPVRDDD